MLADVRGRVVAWSRHTGCGWLKKGVRKLLTLIAMTEFEGARARGKIKSYKEAMR